MFGLALIYGQWQVKGEVLQGVKVQVPLFGTYLSKQDDFDEMLAACRENGVYIERNILQTNNGIVYQMTISDWEVLSCMAKWHKDLATLEKISTKDLADYHRSLLVAYMMNQ